MPPVAGPFVSRCRTDRRSEACLHEEHLAALVDLARRVERHYGAHQDVEWALARGRRLPDALVVLQARPVTAVPERAPKLSGSALSLVLSTFGAASPKDAERLTSGCRSTTTTSARSSG